MTIRVWDREATDIEVTAFRQIGRPPVAIDQHGESTLHEWVVRAQVGAEARLRAVQLRWAVLLPEVGEPRQSLNIMGIRGRNLLVGGVIPPTAEDITPELEEVC